MNSFAQIVYNCDDPNEYKKILNEYDNVIKKVAISKKKYPLFIELDHFYRFELPKSIKQKRYLELGELSKIMQYKLIRGKMRPLQKRIDNNDPNIVKSCTKKAIKLLDDGKWLNGLKIMIDELDGVGIATASYIAALVRPDLCPIMSDEIIQLFSNDKRGYTLGVYKNIQKNLLVKVTNLNSKNLDFSWNMLNAEMVFWLIGHHDFS
jgi:hypothetical protein